MTAITREQLVVQVAARILALDETSPRVVAITGMSCIGKTTLAAEVAAVVEGAGRPVVQVAYDDFHHPRERRYRLGRRSAEGYLDDSYDAASLRRLVLEPLSRGEASVRTASYDLAGEKPVAPQPVAIEPGSVVLVEGEFLLASQVGADWDLAILLMGEPGAVLERALVRDADFGTGEQVREMYLRRYLAAESLHQERDDPWLRADVIVDLTDPLAPDLLVGG
jgi:uridine kinase